MNKDKKLTLSEVEGLIPELRFPEFTETWNIISVSDVCDVFRGGIFSKADMDENGSQPCIHYGELFTKYNEVISTIYSKTNKSDGFKSNAGDILMPSSDVTPDGLAKASAIQIDNVVLGGDMNILRPKTKTNSVFFSYLLNHSKKEIIKLVSGTTVKHIYPSQIVTCKIPTVNSEQEQQRIASCLSSLDEVIAAHGEKLDLLKGHKKGLMQNLFPQEGESVPKYRFKEFEKDGEWVEKTLIDTADKKVKWSFTGGPFGSNLMASDYTASGFRIIQLQNIGDGVFNDDNKIYASIEKADELLSCNIYAGDIIISKMGDPVGRACIIPDSLHRCIMASDGIRLVVDETKYSKYFIYSLINSKRIREAIDKRATGSTRKRIGLDTLREIELIVPKSPQEQQKIASCLSSLDALISAQAEKIAQLKLHKKGLMQGLFPKIQE